MRLTAMTALAAWVVTGAAVAQDGLTEDEVRGFVSAMVEDAERIVAEGDRAALSGWIEGNFAGEARLAAEGSLATRDGPVVSYEIVADREDLVRFAGMVFAGPHGMGEAIRDFSLSAAVQEVTILPTGEAVAIVRFAESGVLNVPAPEGAEAREPIGFHSVALCDLRLTNEGDGEAVRIAVAACQTTTTM